MNKDAFIEQVRNKLIVSCQALPDEPLYGAQIMARMAVAAQIGGASAIRANSPADIQAIKASVDLPVIGLYKQGDTGIYITPTHEAILAVIAAGCDVVALDATLRPRPSEASLQALFETIHAQGKLILADVSTFEEGQNAQALGADFVAPTLSGYTEYTPILDGPDFELIARLAAELSIPTIAEGRIHTPAQARQALDSGALAVVVGTAITRPRLITKSFVDALL